MTNIARRTALIFTAFALAAPLAAVHAADTLPDSRFVGYAQAINDFEIGSARLAQSLFLSASATYFHSTAPCQPPSSASRL